VVTAASGKLFRKGLLIKHGTALERLAEADTVVFDKTGTLTLGAPEPMNLGDHDAETLGIVLALAGASSHPLARALAASLPLDRIAPAAVTGLREVPGYGVEGDWQGQRVRLGRDIWVGAAPSAVTATFFALGAASARAFTFADHLRPGAEAAVAALRAQGLRVILISGDATGVVSELAPWHR
jgi:Cu2+-exporting ATPase